MPHDKDHVLATVHKGGARHVDQAIKAAAAAWEDWHRTSWEERAAVFLRAAELLSGPWRATLNAATMLGQSKTAHQAEIDAACELTDFWRFNVEFMTRIYKEQPSSAPGTWNRLEYRPLEGFVFAVTPFIVAHPSADVDAVATAIVRGSFEYQGQKCSAASRVYAPSNLWPQLRERLADEIKELKVGDVSDFSNFMGAVIDSKSLATQREAIEEAKAAAKASVLVGGGIEDDEGFFVEPTVIETEDPEFRTMREELFGPVVTAYVYPEKQ